MNIIDIFRQAAREGNLDTIKFWIPYIEPKFEESEALRLASENGHTDIVRLLLPISDPKMFNSYALRWASHNGHTDIVKLLLPLSEPKANDSEPICYAAGNGHMKIIDLLYNDSDVKIVLQYFQENNMISKGISYLERRFKAEQDKKFLQDNLEIISKEKPKRKM